MPQRIYTNREIEEKVAAVAKTLPESELKKLCRKDYSKMIFDLDFALLFKVGDHLEKAEKSAAVKDAGGLNRWTWKFEFNRNGFDYAITTQWYARHDEYVQRWLIRNSK